ncbi:hypothetical protein BJ170DRAFT_630005 [Xylariales sp. AK1849]|nr:hypothetical protein BJ170DRAFT_630005 [Xylariales sp. AK1849]
MQATSDDYRTRIARELLGKSGEFQAYFRLYEELFDLGTRGHIIAIDNPLQHGRGTISHSAILTTVQVLRDNKGLTLDAIKVELEKKLQGDYLPREIDFIVDLAVQAMLMIDSDTREHHGPNYTMGQYRHTSWLTHECFVDFVSRSFPQVSVERRVRVAMALDDKRSLKAWKLKKRLGIVLKGTENLANHLLYDSSNQILYLFHHTAYLKAHLDMWSEEDASKGIGITTTLERGTLSPRLLAETLHSLQSILFCYDDDRSMTILQYLIKRKGFDETCSVHEGYKMFEDSTEDFPYIYWGERLAVLHDLVLNRPPRSGFQRWIKWQTSESNSFLIAMLALIISIVVGILSLGLSAFQAWISWQAWKDSLQASV